MILKKRPRKEGDKRFWQKRDSYIRNFQQLNYVKSPLQTSSSIKTCIEITLNLANTGRENRETL